MTYTPPLSPPWGKRKTPKQRTPCMVTGGRSRHDKRGIDHHPRYSSAAQRSSDRRLATRVVKCGAVRISYLFLLFSFPPFSPSFPLPASGDSLDAVLLPLSHLPSRTLCIVALVRAHLSIYRLWVSAVNPDKTGRNSRAQTSSHRLMNQW